MSGLLVIKSSRNFKIFSLKFPAICRFNGVLYQEFYNIDTNESTWKEVIESDVRPWLEIPKRP